MIGTPGAVTTGTAAASSAPSVTAGNGRGATAQVHREGNGGAHLPRGHANTVAAKAPSAGTSNETATATDDAQEGAPFSSTRNFATSRKVQKLLDITVNDNFREVVLYMNDAVPELLENFLPSSAADASTVEGEKSLSQKRSSPPQQQQQLPQHLTSMPSSTALRSALESRVVDLHRHFLQEWSVLNDAFEEASDMVSKVHQESELLQTTLNSHAALTDDFVALMSNLQAELSLVRRREEEMKEFQEKYHFAAEEQGILDDNPVDATYLDVLQRAQMTHRKCRELLLSREHYQSAASMMDITYSAIMKGTEKVARYLISASAAMPGTNVGFGNDSPEMTSFCLRCVNFLREENISQWAAVVEEVARLRRAAVLRQYFHLMTTGSATTSAGTYRAGKQNNESSKSSSGTRPLEAEIGNPVFFFSSLFAWLHQVIVEEEDFMGAFFPSVLPHEGSSTRKTTTTTVTAASTANDAFAEEDNLTTQMKNKDETLLTEGSHLDNGDNSALPLGKASVLDSIFEVLCKHINGVLEGVLERFLRHASSLQDSDGASVNSLGGGGVGGGVLSSPSGPIGLTGGLTRWLSAATGRPASMTSGSAADGGRRYQCVLNRSQQEALVVATLMGLTNGLRTAHSLLQLFTYYGCTTLIALLGREAALTRLVVDDAKLQLLRVYHAIAKQFSEHALDSVASVVSRCGVLRRLASVSSITAEDTKSEKDSMTYFVTDFLFQHTAEEDRDTDFVGIQDGQANKLLICQEPQSHQPFLSSERSLSSTGRYSIATTTTNNYNNDNPYRRSGLSKRQAQSVDLLRVLYSMILPTPPEVEEGLRVLQATMVEAEKHMEIMESVQTMLSKSSTYNDTTTTTTTPTNSYTAHEGFFTVLVQHILSFPVVLARQHIVYNTLDEPCKLVLQLNTMSSLQETLIPHPGLLALGNVAEGHTMPLSNIVFERIQELREKLITSLSKCAVRHYFCRYPKDKESPSVLKGGDSLGGSLSVYSEIDWEITNVNCEQMDAETISAQLNEFYSMVAASGRVYIPIVAAIRAPRLREQVTQDILRTLCDVYELRYKRLVELQKDQQKSTTHDDEGTCASVPAVESDFDPRKLRILLDV